MNGWRAFALGGLAALTLGACATNPVTGRDQLVALPGAQAHAELRYAVGSKSMRQGLGEPCDHACRLRERDFESQVKRVGAELDAAARIVSPETLERIGAFDIGVDTDLGASTGSSASGRIVLGGGLALLEPDDDVTAFLVAREMGHVMARHAEEDSGASIALSAVTSLLPVAMLLRMAASALGSGAVTSGWAEDQRREADEIALALLARTGRLAGRVARHLAAVKRDPQSEDAWTVRLNESVQRVAQLARDIEPGARSATQADAGTTEAPKPDAPTTDASTTDAPPIDARTNAGADPQFDAWLLRQSESSIQRISACLNAGGAPGSVADMAERRRECMGPPA
ncbi:MAG: M48 family metalloprotease [Betaproteobacteria bacterium]